ncbi:Pentatricopeptide repeat-containing protein [Spatholobus suberectus]|nr:Pentatricopeptide repeat-containing protein [Spatholobus suberectus]
MVVLGDLSFGSWVHEYLISLGHQDLDKAKEVFEHLVSKDVVLFNAMIMDLAVDGEGEDALRLFYKMPEFGLQPNAGTFLGALSGMQSLWVASERSADIQRTNPFQYSFIGTLCLLY